MDAVIASLLQLADTREQLEKVRRTKPYLIRRFDGHPNQAALVAELDREEHRLTNLLDRQESAISYGVYSQCN